MQFGFNFQMISSYTLSLWISLLQHTVISPNSVLLTFIPRLFDTASKTLCKVGNSYLKFLCEK